MRDQEGEKERTRRNLQKRLRKSATIKAKKLPNIRKTNLMTESGERKFKVKIESQKLVGKLKAAVARQLAVRRQNVGLRVIFFIFSSIL